MAKNLVIVESPSKATTIQKIFRKELRCCGINGSCKRPS